MAIRPKQAEQLAKSREVVTFHSYLDETFRGVVLSRWGRWDVLVHVADEFGDLVPGRTGLFCRDDLTVVQ